MSHKQAVVAMKQFLEALGIDLQAQNMEKTPERVTSLFEDLFSGQGVKASQLVRHAFSSGYEGLVAVKDIPFYSICEHHLMPFFGTVDIVYRPRKGQVTGLSRLRDLVMTLSKRPQLQERMTQQIAEALMEGTQAEGVIVRVQSYQLCMMMRGEVTPTTQTVTIESKGCLKKTGSLRQEALLAIEKGEARSNG